VLEATDYGALRLMWPDGFIISSLNENWRHFDDEHWQHLDDL
jgi:hypothetical protein